MNIKSPRWIIVSLALTVPTAVLATPITYQATLTPLNGSDVSGTATLVLRPNDNALDVTINASGLVPGRLHPQHIHGRFNNAGEPINSVSPPPSEDTDGDGNVELVEALSSYGPVLVPLTSPPGDALAFPTAPGGTISFTQTYDLLDPDTFAPGFGVDGLLPLDLREIVLHGSFEIPGPDANATGLPDLGQQTDNSGEPVYIAALPVASGVIETVQTVPEPATIWLLLIGFAASALWRRKRLQAVRV